MVFSQTSHKARSILKVVDIDITPTGETQANGLTGVVTLGKEEPSTSVQLATTSSAEVFLKTEPLNETTMFSEMISEVFPDLAESCYIPAKEEQIQTIDPAKLISERAPNSDTLHTPFSPQEWDLYGVSSPTTSQFYVADNLSNRSNSNLDFWLDSATDLGNESQFLLEEQFLDISKMSVVLGDKAPDMNTKPDPWQGPEMGGWSDTHNTNTHNHQMPLIICQEDSMDTRYTEHTQQDEDNNIIVAEYLVDSKIGKAASEKRMRNPLVLNLAPPDDADAGWTLAAVTTPDVLSCVEQLEAGRGHLFPILPEEEAPFASIDVSALPPLAEEYETVSLKSESLAESEIDVKPHTSRRKRSRRSSDDSDETYTPYGSAPRKYNKKRKPNVPIKDKILALAGAQQPTPRRGRPPKRRDSAVSSVCSVDDCASNASSHDNKYRVLRDKNNEASKRSRMNRKLKELQMEQLAVELEEKNRKLQIKVDTLEELTKKLKDTFMAVLLKE